MGAWGTSLYANDSASDIRGDYVDKLRRGKTNEEVTRELIEAYHSIMGDLEEEPLFWFALADTQWNYGRLLPIVKDKALYFLSQDMELKRWEESDPKKKDAWIKTLDKLKEKLERPQPPVKKVSKYRLYQCKWQLGDVFAYRFTSDYSREKGFEGKYAIFRKVSEDSWWPGHICPVVQFYKWIGNVPLSIEKLPELELLPAFYSPEVFKNHKDKKLEYQLVLITESEKSIPKDNLTYLGNLPGDDIVSRKDYWVGYYRIEWETSKHIPKLEHYFIDQYLAWEGNYHMPTG